MLLMIDNFDSFTYNLVQYFMELGEDVCVKRNDEITVEEAIKLKPDRVVISPGPRDPSKAGVSVDMVKHFTGKIPLLGVCLGHQTLAYAFGGEIVRAEKLMHGKTSAIYHNGKTLFKGLSNPFEATRYHSLIVRKESLPDVFEVSAWTEEDEIMGIRHKEFPVEGVQFHPESILTGEGKKLLGNFLEL